MLPSQASYPSRPCWATPPRSPVSAQRWMYLPSRIQASPPGTIQGETPMATVTGRCTGPASRTTPNAFLCFSSTTPTQMHVPNPPVGRPFTTLLILMPRTALTFLSRPVLTLTQGPTQGRPHCALRPRKMRLDLPNCSWRLAPTPLSDALTAPPPLATMGSNNSPIPADLAGETKKNHQYRFIACFQIFDLFTCSYLTHSFTFFSSFWVSISLQLHATSLLFALQCS